MPVTKQSPVGGAAVAEATIAQPTKPIQIQEPKIVIPAPHRKVLNVQLIAQQTSMWCWAASAEMVMKYLGHDVSQCQQANHEFGRSDCCSSPIPGPCIQGGWPQFSAWGFSSQQTAWGVALTFDQIVGQIDNNDPFCFSWGWTGGGGHMMVCRGYQWGPFTLLIGPSIYINDPWAPNVGNSRWMPYSYFVAAAHDHVHWVDYYNIKYTGTGSVPKMEEHLQTMDTSTHGAPAGYGDSETAAREFLKDLPAFVTPETAHELGFDTVPTNPSTLALGQALPVFYIRHDRLAAHVTGADVRQLLVDGEEMLYPIYKDGKAVSSVVVAKQQGVWGFRSFGDSNLVKQITEVRDRLASTAGKDHSKYFIVHIPSMYQMFVAHYDTTGKLLLTSIHDDPTHRLFIHSTQSAEQVINALLPDAKLLKFALPKRG